MFLAKAGTYPPCGLFSIGHFIILTIVLIGVILALKFIKVESKKDVKKIIRIATLIVWILEILKTIFNYVVEGGTNPNKMIPLYYCSLLLYAGVLSSVGKGKVKKIGDIFLATGAMVGGMVFLLFPTTSLPEYPVFHFISMHSFIYHGIMIYVSILVNYTKYVEIKLSDIKYYSGMIFVICVAAYIVNSIFDSNLMFISKDFPGTPLSPIYHFTGKYYTVLMSLVQMTLPFLLVYGILKLINKYIKSNKNLEEGNS